jgi:ribonucleoside-diphosphate reductase alpha chain
MRSGCGKLYVTVNEKDGKPYEIFIAAEGGCTAFSDALARTLSLSLRFGAPVRDIIRQLARVRCQTAMKNPQSDGKSCAAIIAQCINLSIPDEDEEVVVTAQALPAQEVPGGEDASICPSCGSKLEFGEGCNRGICKICSWSGCS